MSEAFRSAVALRNDLCKTLAQLRQRNSRKIPNGATVFVTDANGLYRLYRGFGSSLDALTDLVLVPADQSSNRWIAQEVNGASPWSAQVVATTDLGVTIVTQSTWAQLAAGGSFSLNYGAASVFSVSAVGTVTYTGPTISALVTAYGSFINTAGATQVTASMAISVNNDITGTTSGRTAGEQSASPEDILAENIIASRPVTLGAGMTLRPVFRNFTNTDDLGLTFYQMLITPL